VLRGRGAEVAEFEHYVEMVSPRYFVLLAFGALGLEGGGERLALGFELGCFVFSPTHHAGGKTRLRLDAELLGLGFIELQGFVD